MIDAYYFGKVDRISPEAPVPIVAVEKRENRLGGAANVALNIQALGATPILCSVIGTDSDSNTFESLLNDKNLTTEGIIKNKNRVTTVKTRIIGNSHQILRVDSETDENLSTEDSDILFNRINFILDNKKVDVVIFEDYDKGVITKELIEKVVALTSEKNIPTAVDPKKRNFSAYKNVSLFKPNLKELKEGLNIEINYADLASIEIAIQKLNTTQSNTITFITLSENGVYINKGGKNNHIPAHIRNIADVSGAGDTVISVASLCLALNQDINVIAKVSNLAGGLVCERVGVVPINKELLLAESISKLVK